MGVTYDHYRIKLDLHNDAKYPFNRSDWQDFYLNPFRYSYPEGEIAYLLGIPEDDILEIELVEPED